MKPKHYQEKYAIYGGLFDGDKNYSNEADFLESSFAKHSKAPVKKILDLGCGTGNHCNYLAKKGYIVTGLDASEHMIKIAKSKNIPNANFLVGDIADFNLNQKFDAVICMFSVLGYLTENKQLESFFQRAKNHLDKDGLLILDVWNGLGVMNELPSSREKIVEKDNLKIVRRSFPNLDSKNHINNVRFNVKVFQDNNQIEDYDEMHKVRFFFPKELQKYMDDFGFELMHLCPSFKFNEELNESHWNMVLIGRLK